MADTSIGPSPRWASGTVGGQDELLAGNVFHEAWTQLNAYPYSRSNTDHVGTYVGSGRMIDAFRTGTRIQINNVSDASGFLGYWHY